MTKDKVSIRPRIEFIGSVENTSQEENFQNLTLRPILKMQHDLLVAFFENHLQRTKVDFSTLSSFQKTELISNIFTNDIRFKVELRGLIVGHFTLNEYEDYQKMPTNINKRMIAMIKERILSAI
jgi:hypothetical protein